MYSPGTRQTSFTVAEEWQKHFPTHPVPDASFLRTFEYFKWSNIVDAMQSVVLRPRITTKEVAKIITARLHRQQIQERKETQMTCMESGAGGTQCTK
jgi:hypothetical protein